MKKFYLASLIAFVAIWVVVPLVYVRNPWREFSNLTSGLSEFTFAVMIHLMIPLIFIELTYFISHRLYKKDYNFFTVLLISSLIIILGYITYSNAFEFWRLNTVAEAESGIFLLFALFTIPFAAVANFIIQWIVWNKYFRKGAVIKTK